MGGSGLYMGDQYELIKKQASANHVEYNYLNLNLKIFSHFLLMIVYLYFNFYFFKNQDFMKKLKRIYLKFQEEPEDDKIEVHVENGTFYFCRINLSKKYLVDELFQEFEDYEIYKYIIYT